MAKKCRLKDFFVLKKDFLFINIYILKLSSFFLTLRSIIRFLLRLPAMLIVQSISLRIQRLLNIILQFLREFLLVFHGIKCILIFLLFHRESGTQVLFPDSQLLSVLCDGALGMLVLAVYLRRPQDFLLFGSGLFFYFALFLLVNGDVSL